MKTVMISLLATLMSFPSSSFAQTKVQKVEEFDSKKIWLGIPASAFVGFGLGHGVQKRYLETGWIYTVVEGTGVLFLLGAMGTCKSDDQSCKDRQNRNGDIGRALWLGGRVIEIIDSSIWSFQYYQKHQTQVMVLPQKDGAMASLHLRF